MCKYVPSLLLVAILAVNLGCKQNSNAEENLPATPDAPQPIAVIEPGADVYQAWGLAFSSSGQIFVADRGRNKIRVVDSNGEVSDFAGSGVQGHADGNSTEAQFSFPGSLMIDAQDNIYVADWSYHPHYISTIRKISPNGQVSTIASLPAGTGGYVTGLVMDSSGALFAATPHEIWKITSSGTVTSFAGSGLQGVADGNGVSAEFYQIFDLAIDEQDNIWVATSGPTQFALKKVSSSGSVTTMTALGSATAIAYFEDSIYFLDASLGEGNLGRFHIQTGQTSLLMTNVYSQNSGGMMLAIHPTQGFFLDSADNVVASYPHP